MKMSERRLLFFSIILSLQCELLWAQKSATYTPEELHRHFQNEAESYEILAKGATKPFELKPKPLMHWQNTVRQQEQGAMYVWFDGELPAVLASIFTYEYGGTVYCKHECISISEKPFSAKLGNTPVWAPKTAGASWKSIDDAGQPADSLPRRLTQMRSIARHFSGKVTNPEGEATKLELLPQPLIRFQAPQQNVIDGAIFSLAVVTDPELLVMIEAFKEKEKIEWRYCALRSHHWQVDLARNDAPVWTAPLKFELQSAVFNQAPNASEPYFSFKPPVAIPAPEQLR